MSLTQKGIVSVFMFIFLKFTFSSGSSERPFNISSFQTSRENLKTEFPPWRLILGREYAFGSDRDESKTRRSDP